MNNTKLITILILTIALFQLTLTCNEYCGVCNIKSGKEVCEFCRTLRKETGTEICGKPEVNFCAIGGREAGKCSKCLNGYVLSTTSELCQEIPESFTNCVSGEYKDGEFACQTCNNGKAIDSSSNRCELDGQVENCLEHSSPSTCSSCSEGFVSNEDSTQCLKPKIAGCKTVLTVGDDDTEYCRVCALSDSYYANGIESIRFMDNGDEKIARSQVCSYFDRAKAVSEEEKSVSNNVANDETKNGDDNKEAMILKAVGILAFIIIGIVN